MGLRRFPHQTGLVGVLADIGFHSIPASLSILGLVYRFLGHQNRRLLLHG